MFYVFFLYSHVPSLIKVILEDDKLFLIGILNI